MNVVIYVTLLGASPKYRGKLIIPKRIMVTPVNLMNGTTIGFNLMDPIHNWSRVFWKIMLTELSLATNIQCILK